MVFLISPTKPSNPCKWYQQLYIVLKPSSSDMLKMIYHLASQWLQIK